MIVPASCWVWALNALQNSMMLTPCWPSAGPTGGGRSAAPGRIGYLVIVSTFSAIALYLDLLHLVVSALDRGLAAEDRDQDLELRRVLVDLRDLPGEVLQRTGDHLHRLA